MDGKTKAIIAHITLIGWIIALVLNSQEKDEFASFYIRQMLGLILCSFIGLIPVLGWILSLVVFVFWVISLIGAIQGKEQLVPILGEHFQNWFQNL
jgi:uncharacterized membrane protein